MVSSSLRNFKQLPNSQKFNFSCYYCGDSENNPRKARAYLLPNEKGSYYYYCHNCGTPHRFERFLKDIDYQLYKEYKRELITPNEFKISKDILTKTDRFDPSVLSPLPSIDQLDKMHHARQYLEKRKIPTKWFNTLYYTDNFRKFVNSILPGKFEYVNKNDARIVIPFFDYDGKLTGLQGRALYETKLRYITITIDENQPNVWNLNNVNLYEPYYITEGALDAMFLPNAIAASGSGLASLLGKLPHKDNAVIVLDNENRNKDILKQYSSGIEKGYKVCIWPDWLEPKDINNMVLSGLSPEKVKGIIDSNTYSGLMAKAKFSEWKKYGVKDGH